MKNINEFITEKLKLNNQSKLNKLKIGDYLKVVKKVSRLLNFYEDDFKNPKYGDEIYYINKWILDNDVADIEVYITPNHWDMINREWDTKPYLKESEYCVRSIYHIEDKINNIVNLYLAWETGGGKQIIINDEYLLYYTVHHDDTNSLFLVHKK